VRDPQGVPVVGCESHLPAIDPRWLTAGAVRTRCRRLDAIAWSPEFRGDSIRFDTMAQPAEAAVLIGLVAAHEGEDAPLSVLLTQRHAALKKHAGQVSFPGGRRDAGDASAVAAALREAHEEVGLEQSCVDVLGTLPTYSTVTSFVVTPVVAIVQAPAGGLVYRPQPQEVAAVFEVPLAFLMNPSNHQRHRMDWEGGTHDFLSMPWVDETAQGAQRFIWGATAAMLRNMYRLLSVPLGPAT
jgi:8-oxo-dGTP pyrophosphatase MutT (NUDIX family)